MDTSITKRGQTGIPASIRKKYQIKQGGRLLWLDEGKVIKVIPVPADPIRVLKGSGQGEHLLEKLLAARREGM
jgi:bifunctional DNA-binding transcriptional regulator/antitoxin component of YhaV-PrlF toxin-antitoxin module